jgi:hypothetical protein
MRSIGKSARRPAGGPQSGTRPFNTIVVGGGSSGGDALAVDGGGTAL